MVPLLLRLRNFMCYREGTPPLDFEGVHIACLSGQNGHGKSALLDAMTWALWGQARVTSDDELIHLGQSEMEVELEFRAADGGRYRVIRKRTRPRSGRGAGQTGLELQIIGEDGAARPITGGTVRETQAILKDKLGLDYDTFINSAFLVQGRADAFTLKSPAGRKEVLSNILGLGYYDTLEERCRELLREAEGRLTQYTRDLQEMERELQGQEDLKDLVQQAEQDAARLQRDAQAQELVTNSLRERKQALDLRAAQVEELARRIADNQATVTRYQKEAAAEAASIARYEGILARQEEIAARVAELHQARQASEEQTRRLTQVRRLEQQARQLEQEIERQRAALDREVSLLRAEVRGLRPKAEAVARADGELAGLAQEQEQLDAARAVLAERQAHAQDLAAAARRLTEENQRLRKEMDDRKARLDQILETHDAACPLCGTELGLEGKAHIAAQVQAEGRERGDLHRANDRAKRQVEQELKGLQAALVAEEQRLNREVTALTTRRATLAREVQEGAAAAQRLSELAPRLAAQEAALDGKQYAVTEQDALAQVHQEIARLEYDETAYTRSTQRVRELEQYAREARDIEDAERQLPQAQIRKQQAEEMAAHFQELVAGDLRQQATIAADVAARPQVERDLSAAEEALAHLRSTVAQQTELLGGLRQQQERLERMAETRKEKQQAQAEARRERDTYSDLVTAFGKRGIPALIIEQALPELEEEANLLLGRMTDNRMSLTLDTQRQTRAGNVVETLDIRIADELGTRDYDLFSGGEAFRINFALRIALSRLLARRAGAPLPTLIIDEGFGTQDSAGREKLVEVINAIQDDFERILVITHIDELKDLFPVRIEVIKTATGSTLSMIA